jgi:PAS domain S-box-containing protein
MIPVSHNIIEERLRRLQRATSWATLHFSEKIHSLLKLGLDAFGLEYGILAHISGENYTVINAVSPGNTLTIGSAFELGNTYCRNTLENNGPFSIHHASQSPWKTHPCYTTFQLEAYLGVPVAVAEQTYGTLQFSGKTPRTRPFSDNDHEFLQLMGQWVGLELARHQTETALVQFKMTLDQTLDCVFMFSPTTLQFSYVNQGAVDQVGYSRNELLSLTPVDIKPEFQEENFRQMTTEIIDSPQRAKTFETIHQHKSGELIPVEVFLQYVEPQSGEPRFVAIVRDIRERRKVDRLKNDFISTVSHELRTPLTSIHGALSLLEGALGANLEPQARQLVAIACANSKRLISLVNDILDMDKIASGKMRLQVATHNLHGLLTNAIDCNRGYAEKFKVHLKLTSCADEVKVQVDPDRFGQVMANLISNAVKFSPTGESVEISMQRATSDVVIGVHDRGPGISPEFRQRIFAKFAQADSSDARQKGGTGLGLAIAKALIDKMGGAISFESEAARGTNFFLRFPIVP